MSVMLTLTKVRRMSALTARTENPSWLHDVLERGHRDFVS